ncbi:MAG: hypothetical protein AAF333_15870 [Planctomycetota bacterium]
MNIDPALTHDARRWARLIIPLIAVALFSLGGAPNADAKGFKKSFRGHRGSSFKSRGFSNRRFNRGFNRSFNRGFNNRRFVNQRFHRNSFNRFNTTNRFRFQNQRFFNTNRKFARGFNDFDRFDEFGPVTLVDDSRDVFTVRNDDFRGIDRSVDLSVDRNAPIRRRANLGETTAPIYRVPTASRDHAWALLEAGQYTQAQLAFGRLATAHRNDATLKVGFGLASASLGQIERADNAFGRAHTVNPGVWDDLTGRPIAQAIAADLIAGETGLAEASTTQLQRLSAEANVDAYETSETEEAEAAPESTPASP